MIHRSAEVKGKIKEVKGGEREREVRQEKSKKSKKENSIIQKKSSEKTK